VVKLNVDALISTLSTYAVGAALIVLAYIRRDFLLLIVGLSAVSTPLIQLLLRLRGEEK